MRSGWNWVKLKKIDSVFLTLPEKRQDILKHLRLMKISIFVISSFVFILSISLMLWETKLKKYSLELIKRRSKLNEYNTSHEFWALVNIFQKPLANKNLIMDCLQNYWE